ncbi:hypothetical protein [Salinilacihabitans rarus]|uniref:hypothetical protein n=1 Tax=Salinilacihabitans rarus TaxID=2961596 RepID=UPI0020C895D1|nr:hypothetical protein [Salinilacihabitans rarus]
MATKQRARVVLDRTKAHVRYRYVCPHGHIDWDQTNNHIWCRGCRRQAENGDDVDPEHRELVDKKTSEVIPWERIEIVVPEPEEREADA